jgi:hypothetical protein
VYRFRARAVLTTIIRMAVGLGVTPGEWERLRAQVDDSFWVLRIIGASNPTTFNNFTKILSSGYPPLPNDHDGFSCGAHKLAPKFTNSDYHLTMHPFSGTMVA